MTFWIGYALALATIAGCRPFESPSAPVAGIAVADATQRHPILVTQAPAGLALSTPRGAHGLAPHQRAQVIDFLGSYRARPDGASGITVQAPSGSANESAAARVVGEVREIARAAGIPDGALSVRAFHAHYRAEPPVRLSYATLVAQAPECGSWPTNLADDRQNLPYPNLGCATQRNLAVQIANPADLLGPRAMTPPSAERRAVVWDKYIKGESTISAKKEDERASTKTEN